MHVDKYMAPTHPHVAQCVVVQCLRLERTAEFTYVRCGQQHCSICWLSRLYGSVMFHVFLPQLQ